jgi:hypothetical protein
MDIKPFVDRAIDDARTAQWLQLDQDEDIEAVRALVLAIAEVVVEVEQRVPGPLIWRDALLILGLLSYLSEQATDSLKMKIIYPSSKDIRDYIRRKRKALAKKAKEAEGKEAEKEEIKNRVSKEKFDDFRDGADIKVDDIISLY